MMQALRPAEVAFSCWLSQGVGSHYHVLTIATEPECQGQGLGSQVLAQVTAMADSEGRHCYLEVREVYVNHAYLKGGVRSLA